MVKESLIPEAGKGKRIPRPASLGVEIVRANEHGHPLSSTGRQSDRVVDRVDDLVRTVGLGQKQTVVWDFPVGEALAP